MNTNPDGKIRNIEGIRFILCLVIVYFHILNSNIISYTGDSAVYLEMKKLSHNAGMAVEPFFLISGYFLYRTVTTKKDLSIKRFISDKIARLWPVLAFSIIVEVVFFGQDALYALYKLLFLQQTGISLEHIGMNWYVSSMFWSIIFIFAITKIFKEKKANFIIALLVYFGYVFIINYTDGEFGRDIIYNILDLGILRAVAGIGLGYFIALIEKEIRVKFCGENLKIHIRNSISGKILEFVLFSIAEIGSIVILVMDWFLRSEKIDNQFTVVIAFSVLLFCMVFNKGIVSKILDNNLSVFLGKYAYSTYVMQQISFWILQKTVWQHTYFVQNHIFITITFSIVFCVAVGAIVYYAIERPAKALYKKII